MARFVVTIEADLPADEMWRRVFDLRRHEHAIPFTRLPGAPAPQDLHVGTTFTARTALGPFGFEDPMQVIDIVGPEADGPGTIHIRKLGRVVTGEITARVSALGPGRSRLVWEQDIWVWPLPRVLAPVLGPVVGAVARTAYGSVIRRLLADR